jgi:hypothetical protein
MLKIAPELLEACRTAHQLPISFIRKSEARAAPRAPDNRPKNDTLGFPHAGALSSLGGWANSPVWDQERQHVPKRAGYHQRRKRFLAYAFAYGLSGIAGLDHCFAIGVLCLAGYLAALLFKNQCDQCQRRQGKDRFHHLLPSRNRENTVNAIASLPLRHNCRIGAMAAIRRFRSETKGTSRECHAVPSAVAGVLAGAIQMTKA